LFSQLSTPLTNPVLINNRLDIVEYFFNNSQILQVLSEFLRGMPDIERALLRLLSNRGGPRDLIAIKIGLDLTGKIKKSIGNKKFPACIRDIFSDLSELNHVVDNLNKAIISDPPIHSKDGGFVKEGYDEQFDHIQKLKDDSRQLIAEFQKRYVEIADIQTLKIKYNHVLGYFVEVSVKNSEIISGLSNDTFIHRQTMKNVVRYTTIELNELEGKIASAADKALAMEILIFHDLLGKINIEADKISLTAKGLAQLDVSISHAKLAIDSRYCRPKVDDSLSFKIIGGRHPLVESSQSMSLRETMSSEASLKFVKNNCDLSEKNNLWLLTGPNMAGKSTFLRQNALIAILAQIGSFVPADSAHIGVIDRLFSRVGAADDIARGQSTFMVEMVETSLILTQATNRIIIILDEIGRGTPTFDGLSIAWAVVEYLHDVNRSRAIFATHYHELTTLKSKLDSMSCHNMRVKEWQGKIIFLHEVIEGVADRSYGIHVAKLAGLPADVLDRAEMVLQALEGEENPSTLGKRSLEELPLFSEKPHFDEPISLKNAKLKVELDNIIADEMSPRDALEFIYKLKGLAS
jgi:DNA mismatch repair protein MutS